MKWVIQEDVFDENYTDDMEEALGDLGLARGTGYEIIKYIPFAEPSAYLPIQPDNNVIVYGSINLLKQVQKYTNWKPGAGVTWENYECSRYYPHFSRFMLNGNGALWLPLRNLAKEMKRIDKPMFIRPSAGDKAWVGGVYDPYEAERHAEYVMSRHDPDMLMLVAEPRDISYEWRFFVIGDDIVTGSQYHYMGKKDVKPLDGSWNQFGAFILMTQMLQEVKYRPDPVFAFDIAKAENNQYYLLELSAFNCAGFYAANIKKLVTRVHEYYKARE